MFEALCDEGKQTESYKKFYSNRKEDGKYMEVSPPH